MSLQDLILKLKGGPGSGNWGHAGRRNKRGGSAERTGGLFRMGLTSSSTVEQRQSRSSLQKIERAEYQKGFIDDRGNYVASYETRKARRIYEAVVKDNFEKRVKLQEKIDKIDKNSEALRNEWFSLADKNDKRTTEIENQLNKNREKAAALYEKMKSLKQIVNADNLDLQMKNAIFPEKPGNAKIDDIPEHLITNTYRFRGAIMDFNKMVAPSVTKGVTANIDYQPGVRSYQTGENKIVMGTEDKGTFIHEMGHVLEASNPKVGKAAQAFLKARTKGEETKKLADVTGNKAYKEDEVTKTDKFIDSYMGKQYTTTSFESTPSGLPTVKVKTTATEITSMGLEYMYKDPIRLYEKDPEYFDFMVDVMNGRI